MDKPRSGRRKMHTYTVAALLALFVGAAVVALASRLLPGGLSGVVARKFRKGGEGAGSGDASGSGQAPGSGEGGSGSGGSGSEKP